MNKARGCRVPGDGMLTHERWGFCPPPPRRSATAFKSVKCDIISVISLTVNF